MLIVMENVSELLDDTKTAEPGHYKLVAKDDELRMRWADQARRQAEDILRSEQLRAAIVKAIREGESEREILQLALECIGLITGDRSAAAVYRRQAQTP